MMDKTTTRRSFLRLASRTCGGALLAAGCTGGKEESHTPDASAGEPMPAAVPADSKPTELVIKSVKDLKRPNSEVRIGCCWGQVGVPYWDAVTVGVKAAEKRWGFAPIRIGGPTINDPRAQIAEVETWIAQRFDAIVYQAVDSEASVPTINKAVSRGIPVITIDSDAHKSNRTVFDNQANDQDQAEAIIDQLAAEINATGEWAFIVGEFTQAQKMYQVDWAKKYANEKYPKMQFVRLEESKIDEARAADVAQQLMIAYPNLKGIVTNCGAGTPGAAQGIRQAGKSGKIKITGTGVPSTLKTFVADGTITRFFLWDPTHLGYRAIAIVNELLHGRDITPATRLSRWDDSDEPADIRPNLQNPQVLDIVLGPPLAIHKGNIDQFTF